MKIAIAQLNPIVGDIDGNTAKIISIIKGAKADIVVFPELSITGYSSQDLLLRGDFVERNIAALKKIMQSTHGKAAIVGFAEKVEKSVYNSAAVIQDQQFLEIHRKICLPNYSIFDEKRWFKEGNHATVFDFRGKTMGLNICEDIWFPETVKKQKNSGAEMIINISASPYRKGKIEAMENVLLQRWNESKIPIVFVNQAGSQDGIVYYGHSMYFNNGKVIKKCRDFGEEVLIVDI